MCFISLRHLVAEILASEINKLFLRHPVHYTRIQLLLSAMNCDSESKIMTANYENRILLLIMYEISEAEPSDIVTLIIICIVAP